MASTGSVTDLPRRLASTTLPEPVEGSIASTGSATDPLREPATRCLSSSKAASPRQARPPICRVSSPPPRCLRQAQAAFVSTNDTSHHPPARLADATLAACSSKGVDLAKLQRAGLPVPPGFVVTTDARAASPTTCNRSSWPPWPPRTATRPKRWKPPPPPSAPASPPCCPFPRTWLLPSSTPPHVLHHRSPFTEYQITFRKPSAPPPPPTCPT